jgi:O-antigen/teichoic acid export membrane protein
MTLSRAKAFKNVIYASLNKGVTLVCIAVTSSVVARNLSPSDFGVVGFAGIVIAFLSHFSDMGVGSAVIRRPSLTEGSLRTAFTLKVILSVGAFIVAYSIAPFARHFFQHPATGNVIRILAFDFLVSTIGFMPLVTLTREQNYRALLIPGVVSVVSRSALAVTLVLCGWKFWAVVFADVGANLAGSIANQITRRIPVRFRFDWPVAKEYLRFGAPLLGSGVLVFLIFNLDNLLIGSAMGSARLGYYALAFTWGSFICGLLNDTVNSVLLPAFAAIQGDLKAIRRWYLKTLDLVGFVSVAANITLLTNAHFFLVTFLGKGSSKWLPALTSLQILCVYGIMRAMTEPLSNCIVALGSTRTLLRSTVLAGIVECVLLLLVLRSGKIEFVALVVLFAYGLQAVIYAPFLRNQLGIGIGDLLGQLWPLFPAAVGGYLATSLLPTSFGETLPTLAVRALFTGAAVVLIHGLCTRFRCFQEASAMVLQNFAGRRLAREVVQPLIPG